MMAKAEGSMVINRSASDIFAFLTDIEKGTEWQSELLESSKTSTGPIGLGTTIREVRRFLGRSIESVFQVTEFEPNQKLAFQSTVAPFPMRGQYVLEPEAEDGGTRVTFVIEADLSGAFKMAETIVVHTARRQIDADLTKLKALLEA